METDSQRQISGSNFALVPIAYGLIALERSQPQIEALSR